MWCQEKEPPKMTLRLESAIFRGKRLLRWESVSVYMFVDGNRSGYVAITVHQLKKSPESRRGFRDRRSKETDYLLDNFD